MKIHHLNTATFCPRALPQNLLGKRAIEFCCHCLAIETEKGLVLVDPGFSTFDCMNPDIRLGKTFTLLGAELKVENTALHQLKKLGFKPSDVQHIIVTHMDPDHVGAVADFPHARVHIHKKEYEAMQEAMETNSIWKQRFRPLQWEGNKTWSFYDSDGEPWHNLYRIRALDGLRENIFLVPLFGHTAGHSGVLIEGTESDEILHVGDSYYDSSELLEKDYFSLYQNYSFLMAYDKVGRTVSLFKLKKLREMSRVQMICSHDPKGFKK